MVASYTQIDPHTERTHAMGGQPAFSGNTGGRSKGNMYGEAGRGRGQGGRGGRGGVGGGGDWANQKSRLQQAMEEDAHEATLGYANFSEGDERLGFLMNVAAVRLPGVPLFFPRTRVSQSLEHLDLQTKRTIVAGVVVGAPDSRDLVFAFLKFARNRDTRGRVADASLNPRVASKTRSCAPRMSQSVVTAFPRHKKTTGSHHPANRGPPLNTRARSFGGHRPFPSDS